MIRRILPFFIRLSCSALLLSLARPAAAVPVLFSPEAIDTESIVQELSGLSTPDAVTQRTLATLQNPQQAKLALNRLQRDLRDNGELGNIVTLAPRIMELLPDNTAIRNMYALALAAKGETSAAAAVIEAMPAGSEPSDLYASLAKSAIAKAGGRLTEAGTAASRAAAIDSEHPYSYNLLGQIDIERRDFESARENFQTATLYAPRFSAAWSNLGSVQYLQGESKQAWTSFSTAIDLSPHFCAPRIGRAAVSSDRGDSTNAISDLEACLKSEPQQPLASRLLATQYLQSGRLDDAENIANALSAADSDYARIILADIYLRRNLPKEARKQLQAITKPDVQVHYLLSFCDMIEGRHHDAVKRIKQAEALQADAATLAVVGQIYHFYTGMPVDQTKLIRLGQDVAVGQLALYVAGNVSASAGNLDEAYRLWSKTENLLPGFTLQGVSRAQVGKSVDRGEQRHLALGILYYLKSLYPAAQSEFTKALDTNTDSFMANYLAALAVAQAGDSDTAGKYLQRSLKQTPGFFPANYMLAEIYLRRADIDAAIRHYQAAADSKPDGGVLIKLGLLYEQNKRKKEAEKAYRKFIATYPDNFIGYNQLAWMFTRDGVRLDEALGLASKANELQTDNASVNDTLGWIYFQKNDYAQAKKYLQHANTISNGKNPDILFHLASLENALGNTSAAKTLVKRALENSANFESASQARQLLENLRAN
ncbi:MAG: tetratricopeptide repeat protein [Thiotrichales bacterium]|nr:MAG: tetratricopeptide repeat protein [Thiotrichales bacterium]